MILSNIEKIIKEKYSKCTKLKDVAKLQEEIQQINNLIAGYKWTELTNEKLE